MIGRLRRIVNQGPSPQFLEWQRRVHPARVIEVAVDQTIEEMTKFESAFATRGVGVADNVDGAAVTQQMIKLRSIGELVDPIQVDQQQSAHVLGWRVEMI